MEYKKILLPDNLCDEATRYIKKVIDTLSKTKQLNIIDESVYYILADCYSNYIKATKKVESEGMTFTSNQGNLNVSPYVKIARDNLGTVIQISNEMGLNIRSRSKIKAVEAETEDSPLAKFLKTN